MYVYIKYKSHVPLRLRADSKRAWYVCEEREGGKSLVNLPRFSNTE